jgi:diguanylate cyclase (GGDEF)-like protein/PAS domain S-box-containing protein
MAQPSPIRGELPQLPAHIRALVDASADASAVVDSSLTLLYFNPSYLQLAGLTMRDVRKRAFQEMCHTHFGLEICSMQGCVARSAFEVKRAVRADEVASKLDDRRFIVTAIPIPDDHGKIAYVVETYRDVTAESRMQENYKRLIEREKQRNKILEEEVRRQTHELSVTNTRLQSALDQVSMLARTDALTGIHNRRYFDEQFGLEMNRVVRFKRPLSLAIFDLDRFKQVNDQHGHAGGDGVLRRFAEIAKRETRSTDILARIGGEEFGLLMLETGIEDAIAVADRLRKAQQRDGLITTVSGGVAMAPLHGLAIEEIFAAADGALYAAKARGRNNVLGAPRPDRATWDLPSG